MTAYKSWADGLIYAAVRRLSDQALTAPRPIVFGSLLRTLHHIVAMDQVWRAHLLGEPHGFTTRNPESCPSLAELREAQAALNEWYEGYAASLAPSALSERVLFDFIGGQRGEMTREEIILHVVNHGTYHRGNVTDMMYESSITPPTTDLPVFLREQRTQSAG